VSFDGRIGFRAGGAIVLRWLESALVLATVFDDGAGKPKT
jgi:hypothetical protein